jgi:hypothetical protein
MNNECINTFMREKSASLAGVDPACCREDELKQRTVKPPCLVRREFTRISKSYLCNMSYEPVTVQLFAVPLGVIGM